MTLDRTIRSALMVCLAAAGPLALADAPKDVPKQPRRPNRLLAPIKDVPGLPRVLLIGDSISMGYTLPVRKELEGEGQRAPAADELRADHRGLAGIEAWLGDGKWDVIHFNWGLHDLKYMGPNNENLADPKASDSHQQVPPAEYEKNLRQLVTRLKQTGAKLIWRNTTPVPEGARGRVVGDSAKYNAIAAKVMKENDIPTHDLFAFVKPRQDTIMRKADVHFTREGSAALAEDVARVIMETLGK